MKIGECRLCGWKATGMSKGNIGIGSRGHPEAVITGAVHSSLTTGAVATTIPASQGLYIFGEV